MSDRLARSENSDNVLWIHFSATTRICYIKNAFFCDKGKTLSPTIYHLNTSGRRLSQSTTQLHFYSIYCGYILRSVALNITKAVNWSKDVQLPPCRRQGGEEIQLLPILDIGTKWGWVVSVTPQLRFTPREMTPGTHWIGDWVGLRAGLDTAARGKILFLFRGSNPGSPVRNQTLKTRYPAPSSYFPKQN
jgi:hypothetical protein